jgi:hypothetical protein
VEEAEGAEEGAAAPAAALAAVEQAAVGQAAEAEDRSEAYLQRIQELTPRPAIICAPIALASISLRMTISPLATPARSGM